MQLEKGSREEFIKGLKLIIRQGYDSKSITNYAFDFYLKHKISDKILYEVVEDIMIIDAGPEFELTEPWEVAEYTLRGIKKGDFWIFPDDNEKSFEKVRKRTDDILNRRTPEYPEP